MATTEYLVGAHFDWRRGLSEPVSHARGFYGVFAASIGPAFAVTLSNVSVIGMLVIASVVGGLGTPIGVILLILLARDGEVMGARPISSHLAIAGCAVAIVVGGLGLLCIVGAALGKLLTEEQSRKSTAETRDFNDAPCGFGRTNAARLRALVENAKDAGLPAGPRVAIASRGQLVCIAERAHRVLSAPGERSPGRE